MAALLLLLISGIAFLTWMAWTADRSMRTQLLQQTRMVAQALNVHSIQALTGTPSDIDSPHYQLLKRQLAAVRATNRDYRFLYLVGRKPDGDLFFYVDSEPDASENCSPPGQIYDEASEDHRQIFDSQIGVVEGPIADRWGTWISPLTPLIDPITGETIAVLGMDVDAANWTLKIATSISWPVSLMLILLTLTGFAVSATHPVQATAKPVLWRVLPPVAAMTILLVVGAGLILVHQQRVRLAEEMRHEVNVVSNNFTEVLKQQAGGLATSLHAMAADAELQFALPLEDRVRLLEKWQPVFETLRNEGQVTQLSFLNAQRVCLLRMHQPDRHGDVIDRFTVREATRTGRVTAGIELEAHGAFTLRAVHPVFSERQLIGYVELGKGINDVLKSLHTKTGNEVAMLIHKDHVDPAAWRENADREGPSTDWDMLSKCLVAYTSQGHLPEEVASLARSDAEHGHSHARGSEEIYCRGKSWFVATTPIADVAGDEVGTLFVMCDVSTYKSAFFRVLLLSVIAASILLCVLLTFVYALLRRTDAGIRAQQAELRQNLVALESANQALTHLNGLAESATRAKSEFLANMSHEIRTPMTAILGYADLLLGDIGLDSLSTAQIDAVQTIQRNGQYLLALINDILDLSKIEAGKFEVDRIPCRPLEILRESLALMRIRADAKRLTLSLECDGEIPETIHSDPIRLRQILINLIGNAIKFTDVGRIRVVTRLVQEPDHASVLQIDVVDTGIGLTRVQIAKLFRPFSQADSSAKRRFGGTGLGLTISKRLAEMLGGDISLDSVPGQGSTFRVTISTGSLNGIRLIGGEAADESAVAPTQPMNPALPPIEGRILLAEDGPDNQRLISLILKKAGAQVTIAENGRLAYDEAIGALNCGEPYDLILMDMQMPVMDGYETTRRLRERGYSGPIVALTAHAMEGDGVKCRAAGCDGYFTKPIERHKLLTAVAEIVGPRAIAL